MFDIAEFIDACRAALARPEPAAEVGEVVGAAIGHPGWIEAAVAPIGGGGPKFLHRSADLTVYCTVSEAGHALAPHEHLLWAVAGIAEGDEQNVLYARTGDRLAKDRTVDLVAGDVLVLDEHAVHAARSRSRTAAVHVYGGDIMSTPRSSWDDTGAVRVVTPVLPAGSAADADRWVINMRERHRADATAPRP